MNKFYQRKGSNVQGRRKRIQLLEASGKVFAKLGYEGATVRDIAEEANVQPSALIYHFQSKKNLFHETLRYHLWDNARINHFFDAFNEVDSSDHSAMSNALYDCVSNIIHAVLGPTGQVKNLSGLMIALLTSDNNDDVAVVAKMRDESSSILQKKVMQLDSSKTPNDFYWLRHFFWSMIFFTVYGQYFLLNDANIKKFSKEYVETLVCRITKATCSLMGIPYVERQEPWKLGDKE